MDSGALPDCRPDGLADASGGRRQLALTPSRQRRLGIVVRAVFGAALVAASTTLAHAADTGYEWHLPRGFPTPAVPADNPMSEQKVALGKRLFFDTRLS